MLKNHKNLISVFTILLNVLLGCKSKDEVVIPEKGAIVTTLAGNGLPGYENGLGKKASFSFPNAITTDRQGNIYVGCGSDYYIRKITPEGLVSTVPGGLLEPMLSPDVFGTLAIAIDSKNNIYLTYKSCHLITKISPNGDKTTFTGSETSGYIDGPINKALFGTISALEIDVNDNIYVGDGGNMQVRKITPQGIVSTVPGIGLKVFQDGSSTELIGVVGISSDEEGNIYTSDPVLTRICKTTPTGEVTVLGNFHYPRGMVRDSQGNIYVIDRFTIKKLAKNGEITTIAGSKTTTGYRDGIGKEALFYAPSSIAIDPTEKILYVADSANNLIRKIVLP